MGWATQHIEKLKSGETVQFRPTGKSMTGRVNDGQLVTVVPLADGEPALNDVVLCNVRGNEYLHIVVRIQPKPLRYQIGNNKGGLNGWVERASIFGKMTKVEP